MGHKRGCLFWLNVPAGVSNMQAEWDVRLQRQPENTVPLVMTDAGVESRSTKTAGGMEADQQSGHFVKVRTEPKQKRQIL